MAQIRLRVDDPVKQKVETEAPNGETLEAIQEVQRMKATPNLGKTYTNVDQMMEELLAEEVDKTPLSFA